MPRNFVSTELCTAASKLPTAGSGMAAKVARTTTPANERPLLAADPLEDRALRTLCSFAEWPILAAMLLLSTRPLA
jgi:hypothetical protein